MYLRCFTLVPVMALLLGCSGAEEERQKAEEERDRAAKLQREIGLAKGQAIEDRDRAELAQREEKRAREQADMARMQAEVSRQEQGKVRQKLERDFVQLLEAYLRGSWKVVVAERDGKPFAEALDTVLVFEKRKLLVQYRDKAKSGRYKVAAGSPAQIDLVTDEGVKGEE